MSEENFEGINMQKIIDLNVQAADDLIRSAFIFRTLITKKQAAGKAARLKFNIMHCAFSNFITNVKQISYTSSSIPFHRKSKLLQHA